MSSRLRRTLWRARSSRWRAGGIALLALLLLPIAAADWSVPPCTTQPGAYGNECHELEREPGVQGISGVGDGVDALRAGRYEDAIELFRRRASELGEVEDFRLLAGALIEVGRYREAAALAVKFERRWPGSAEFATSQGRALQQIGDLQNAEAAFERAIAHSATDAMTARLQLAILRFERGERQLAWRGFEDLVSIHRSGQRLSVEQLAAAGMALQYLGLLQPQRFRDAVGAYEAAIEADPGDPVPRLMLAELFLEKYNSSDAAVLVDEVLQTNPRHPSALLAVARLRQFDNAAGVGEKAREGLESNANLVTARVFLAALLLGQEDNLAAKAEIEQALAVNPVSLSALSVLAAIRYLDDDIEEYEHSVQRVLDLNPGYSELFVILAEVCVQNRRYQEAIGFARRATELDPISWKGHSILGLNLLRVGAIEEGRQSLEESFSGDPYNVWVKNTLDLLDTFPGYVESRTDTFEVMVAASESELLAPYVTEIAEEAYESLAARYQYRPPTPVRIEIYPSHADFSVRTVGLAGLGALGVSFGPVIAIDSPSARERGEFNWGSTLWHEIAHTFAIGVSNGRVPRWLTEGLSVYEERRARRGWGDDPSPDFLVAFLKQKLLPVSRLTDGFVRPSYPEQVGHSYLQASLVCELIDEEFGFAALLEMLRAYGDGKTNDEVVAEVLGLQPAELDQRFVDYLRARYAVPLAALAKSLQAAAAASSGGAMLNDTIAPSSKSSSTQLQQRALADPDDFTAQLGWGIILFRQRRLAEAVGFLQRAKALFPDYAGKDNPYWYLAQIEEQMGRTERAVAELSELIDRSDKHYDAHLKLAELQESGNSAAAATTLERALFIYPFGAEIHRRLAEMYSRSGNLVAAIRERRAVVAEDPVDRAEALYLLARAHFDAGELASARLQVLGALEIAPGFERAQGLLLELHAGQPQP